MNCLCRIILMAMMSLSAVSLFAEKQIGLTLINNVSAMHSLSNDVLGASNSLKYGGDFDLHLTASPGMVYEDNFQSDGLLDLYIVKTYDTNMISINVKQAFIDLLFYDAVSLKAGFIQVDYGFNNNYFHPLNVSEFVPEFRALYPDIYIGANDLGMPGVPSISMKFTLPEFVEGLKVGLGQSLVWFDFTNLGNNYFLTSADAVYGGLQAGAVLGYSIGSFGGDTNARKPVLGMDMSVSLPFNSMLLWEGVYRQESFRSYVENGVLSNKREYPFFNQSVRLETSQEDPVFHNSLNVYAEYFYYDEGLSADGYDQVYDLMKNQTNIGLRYMYQSSLIIKERNFKNNLTFGAGYQTKQKWNFSYQAIADLDSGYWQHWFGIGKAFNNVTIGGTLIFVPKTDEKYQLLYGARDIMAFFQMSMEI